MPKKPPLITCIFCGDENMPSSGEDVIPLWLADKLAYFAKQRHPDPDTQPEYKEYRYSDADTFAKDMRDNAPGRNADETKDRGKMPLGDKIPDVCRTCNTGWMSHLEHAVRPIMVGLLEGKPKTLDPFDQLVFATWITKTCLTYDAAFADRWIANELGTHRLYLTGIPLTTYHISIGHQPDYISEGARLDERYKKQGVWLGGDTFTAVRFRFQFEALMIRAIINCFINPFESRPGAALHLGDVHQVEIWPHVSRVWWPTEAALTPTRVTEEPVQDVGESQPGQLPSSDHPASPPT
jgi:hypothetical protein